MLNFWLLLTLAIAVLDWIAVARGNKLLEYFAKPATIVALFIWLWTTVGVQGVLIWFALGIFFSLIGDVMLMLPGERFILGLVAFLIAHLFYIVGFAWNMPVFSTWIIVPIVIVALIAWQVYRRLAQSLKRNHPSLLMPVGLYTGVITLMLLTAINTLFRPDWKLQPALVASFGALLFYISDAVLAWNKFVCPIKNGRLMNMIAYHLGQIAIIFGAAMQLSG